MDEVAAALKPVRLGGPVPAVPALEEVADKARAVAVVVVALQVAEPYQRLASPRLVGSVFGATTATSCEGAML